MNYEKKYLKYKKKYFNLKNQKGGIIIPNKLLNKIEIINLITNNRSDIEESFRQQYKNNFSKEKES